MDMAMTSRRIDQLEQLKSEVKTQKEMLKAELDNDPSYRNLAEEAKALTIKRKQLKDQLLGSASNQALLREVKEKQEEIATLQEILSAELMQFYQEKQTDEIADATGEPRKFKVTVTLLPKRGRDVDSEPAKVSF